MTRTEGIHHVTAMAGDPQRNRDFYEGVLGLRLVKRTVNFDDPGMYHLYYGDGVGSPGTILTFFPIPGIRPGGRGAGVVDTVDLAVPIGSLEAWERRLAESGAAAAPDARRDGRAALLTSDPDGMRISLVESARITAPVAWGEGPVPAREAVQGIDGVTLWVRDGARTAQFIGDWIGMQADDDGILRAAGDLGGAVRVVTVPDAPQARMGGGTVHHVAFRSPGDVDQERRLAALRAAGVNVSPVMDRDYFRSIYFREPGGVLLEVATDPPGFTRDEDQDALGAGLRVPTWLEVRRPEIEARLTPLRPAGIEVAG